MRNIYRIIIDQGLFLLGVTIRSYLMLFCRSLSLVIRLIFSQVINLYLIYSQRDCIFLWNQHLGYSYCIVMVGHTYLQAQMKRYQRLQVRFTCWSYFVEPFFINVVMRLSRLGRYGFIILIEKSVWRDLPDNSTDISWIFWLKLKHLEVVSDLRSI